MNSLAINRLAELCSLCIVKQGWDRMYISCTHLSDQIVVCIVYATLCYANDRKYCKCTI